MGTTESSECSASRTTGSDETSVLETSGQELPKVSARGLKPLKVRIQEPQKAANACALEPWEARAGTTGSEMQEKRTLEPQETRARSLKPRDKMSTHSLNVEEPRVEAGKLKVNCELSCRVFLPHPRSPLQCWSI